MEFEVNSLGLLWFDEADPSPSPLRHRIVLAARVDRGAKAAWIVQPQCAAIGVQIHMVVAPRWRQRLAHRQAARHAQVQQQQTGIQVHQQVFAAPAHRLHPAPRQCSRVTAQCPAQRFPQTHGRHLRPGNTVGKTQTGDFNFGEFWHGVRG